MFSGRQFLQIVFIKWQQNHRELGTYIHFDYKIVLRLLLKHNTLEFLFSASCPQIFGNIGEFGAKKYCTDHWATNRIDLFVAIKGDFSSLFFSWTSTSEGEFPTDC